MKIFATKSLLNFTLLLSVLISPLSSAAVNYPIVFTTQVPIPADFATIGSTFANHKASMQSVGRGGDLWIRYTDGGLKNLTKAAGFGNEGFQGAGSIAVRDPAVNWDGDKVVFSMVVGAPAERYQVSTYFWQLYEITNLGKNDTPVIVKVAHQSTNYNNISPVYGQNNRIIFSSDRPIKGLAHLYPHLDEYESTDTVSGLWSLDSGSGDLFMVTHSPSGDFTPIIDSFGRVVFTRWDHLKRDQQADADFNGEGDYAPVNWSSERVDASSSSNMGIGNEIFPEPRSDRPDLLAGTQLRGHNFNHFFPWMINEDGTQLETLNHIGRHELHSYFDKSMNGDDNLEEFIGRAGMTNPNSILNFMHIQEDPVRTGVYIGIETPEFDTHSSGKIIELEIPSGMNPADAQIVYLTHPETNIVTNSPSANHSGHYRDPLPLSNGELIASHTSWTGGASNAGTRELPRSNSEFRLKFLSKSAGYFTPSTLLTAGIKKTINYWDPDFNVSYTDNLWELHPVELRPRVRPNQSIDTSLESPETAAFAEAAVNPAQFKSWLFDNNLALIVSRNVTTRDSVDAQQPLNLKIKGSETQSIASAGKVYDISHLQIFQGDMIRGYTGGAASAAGRRAIALPLHDDLGKNPPNPTGPIGSVKLGADGSMAALVPARRALSWQLTDDAGDAVVLERVWLNFAPGEVRVCVSCHGINSVDQSGQAKPINKPQALVDLLKHWLAGNGASSITMINVVGQTQAEAETAITTTGLVVGTITNTTHATVVSGDVISSNPVSGAVIAAGSTVELLISSGLPPVTNIVIPNVSGQTMSAAESVLEFLGFTVTTSTISSDTVANGVVIESTPASGVTVATGSAIHLVVSSGLTPSTNIAIPDVIGLSTNAAITALEALGFIVNTSSENSTSVASGQIINITPAVGVTAVMGSTVNLVVSIGEEGTQQVSNVMMPSVVNQTTKSAINLIQGLGLKVTTSLENSRNVDAGMILRSIPIAGSVVKTGSNVVIVASSGPPAGTESEVETEPEAETESGTSGGSSGGAINIWFLLMLGLSGLLMRKFKK